MEIVKYESEMHREHMLALLSSRDMDLDLVHDLPKIGFLVLRSNNTPIAAGFLRQCESNAVMLDSMITHSDTEAMTRDYALDNLVKSLIKEAKIQEFSQIIAFTMDSNTLVRAHKHGFALLPHSVIALRLSNGE